MVTMEEQNKMEINGKKIKLAHPMEDWRGNKYEEEFIWENDGSVGGMGIRSQKLCENCKEKPAVRNCCEAERDVGRTHWHGAVHTKDGGLKFLCRECADKENNKWK